jgi:DNA-binding transcriptional LysR family regulator
MFGRLFAESGLSLERLRALVEVGAHGSIVRAAERDPVRQSLYSRQIKELENFFQTSLVERHGKGLRLTASGRELSRISRFFLLGLSNFQRGCLAEGQTYRVGADAAFHECFLLPLVAAAALGQAAIRFRVESVTDAEIERRLHDLTLDFGVITEPALSRPLQVRELGHWRLLLWVPKSLCKTEAEGQRAWKTQRLPLAWPAQLPLESLGFVAGYEPALTCDNFLQARTALAGGRVAALLPDFLPPAVAQSKLLKIQVPELGQVDFVYHLAWNPRLLRLNPHATRRRDALISALAVMLSKT